MFETANSPVGYNSIYTIILRIDLLCEKKEKKTRNILLDKIANNQSS